MFPFLKPTLALVGAILCVVMILQSSNLAPSLKSFASIYEESAAQNLEHNYEVEVVSFVPNVSSTTNGGSGGGGGGGDLHIGTHVVVASTPDDDAALHHHHDTATTAGDEGGGATPAPEVVMEKSTVDELTQHALQNVAKMAKDPCDWQSLRSVAVLNTTDGTWHYPPSSSGAATAAGSSSGSFCNGKTQGIRFPITGDQILKHLNGKRIAFMGDSVARNSFVLTMARMCNAKNFDKCITRTPTMEFDVVNPPNNRGPMGCVPNVTDPRIKSLCYEGGRFANIPLKGLTLRSVPQDRNGRRNFIRKGLIGPVMGMVYGNVSLMYHPVTKPNQLAKTGLWMGRHSNSLLHADIIIVSIGPHLRLPEVQATPETLIQGLTALRAATTAPIIAAEFVHALGSHPSYIAYVDGLMDTLRQKMEPLGVTLVPQRFITKHGFMLSSGKVSKAEAEGTVQKGCGYYDPQHPALRCQMVTSDMLLGAGMIKMLQQQKEEATQQ